MTVILLGFFTAFFVVLITSPSLIKVAKLKHLVDEPSEARKHHKVSVPTIGGIIIFASIVFAYSMWIPNERVPLLEGVDTSNYIASAFGQFKYVIASMVILFFMGIKDDIIGTAPVKKLIGHLIVAFILVMIAGVRIESMHGLLGVYELPEWGSVLLTVFVYIVIVNAFNLIDGVDGLAAGVGLISSVFFGVWFYWVNDISLALLAFILAGSLLGFLLFNFSPAKLFMGDSGSLTIGLIISVLAIDAIDHSTEGLPSFLANVSVPVFVMTIMAYPLIDTLRVFIYRAIKGISPFTADRNHIHHRLLALGLSHAKTVFVIYGFSIVAVLFSVIFSFENPTVSLFVVIILVVLLALLPFVLKKKLK